MYVDKQTDIVCHITAARYGKKFFLRKMTISVQYLGMHLSADGCEMVGKTNKLGREVLGNHYCN